MKLLDLFKKRKDPKTTSEEVSSRQAKISQTKIAEQNDVPPFWRDKTGKIFCPGDDCKAKCDDRCPIWWNTRGVKYLTTRQPFPAISNLEKAVAIAPDFAEAYNNLGAAHGAVNHHQQAYEAYKKALSLKSPYPNALYGLIVSEKNLGMYQEALAHCDEYDNLPGCSSIDLRAEIANMMNPQVHTDSAQEPETELTQEPEKESSDQGSFLVVANELLEKGRNAGYIVSDSLSFIPELLVQADTVCEKIYNEINDYCENNPGANLISLTLMWSVFAGMGSVFFWDKDWNKLSADGIIETLTRTRDLGEMDEYVLDTIGIGFSTSKGKEITQFIYGLSGYCLYRTVDGRTEFGLDDVLRAAKSMFAWGMVFEMNRLGMR